MIDGSHGCAAWRDLSPKLGHHPPTEEPVLPPSESLYETPADVPLVFKQTASDDPAIISALRTFQTAYHRSNERLSPARDKQSGIPLHVRGDVTGRVPDVSKAQFAKLLKLVTFHLSSISCLYVQDGAICSSRECDAKVRIISDNPSAIMLLSNILWKIPDRAISHDTSPLTIYATSSISNNIKTILGSGTQYANGFAAADIERASLILCGKAYAAPVPYHQYQSSLLARLRTISWLAIMMLKEDDTPTYLINAKHSGKYIDGKGFMKLLELALSQNLPDIKTEEFRVGELKGKYRSFLSSKFGKCLPEEFSF
ncbi:uncharacterized protein C2845_PM15G20290 [Panicum miliaceum]|uniref:Phosphoenolpyruvate carboxykinase (ATP) n=1 Tax=Panicum miliaceum TaxID=4540 RepID=A0A3L6Q836_PANMI|nr:uncharacterized protein C2845_PM15G20290 [Panicum miliaceum]